MKIRMMRPRLAPMKARTLGGSPATERIRGGTLQRIRARHFAENPLCVLCAAKDPPETRLATELDHIVPLCMGGAEADHNRRGLCHDCHAAVTAEQARSRQGRGI